ERTRALPALAAGALREGAIRARPVPTRSLGERLVAVAAGRTVAESLIALAGRRAAGQGTVGILAEGTIAALGAVEALGAPAIAIARALGEGLAVAELPVVPGEPFLRAFSRTVSLWASAVR